MATMNPFDLLGDDDNDDPSQLIAKKALAPTTAPPQPQQPKQSAKPQQQQQHQAQQPKLPSKPVPPAQAVREAKSDGRGGGRGGGRGFGRGGRGGSGFNRDRPNNENSFSNNGFSAGYGGAPEEGGEAEKSSERRGGYGGPRGGGGGGFRGRRGGFNNGEAGDGERPRRTYERRSGSGTGRGNEIKREGSGRGNWGTPADELTQDSEQQENAIEKNLNVEKQPGEEDAADATKEVTETEEKEPEDKEMTLEEYEKVLEEKRKALQANKAEERKVDAKEFESMLQLSSKKGNDDVFIKLGSEKDKKKDIGDKDDRAKKAVSITEFLKPAEGERYYSPGGRGRGRGRGSRGGYSGGNTNVAAPSIEDPGEFPTLGK